MDTPPSPPPSDSDGSHISATPPSPKGRRRDPSMSPPPSFPSAASSNPHNLPLKLSAAGSHSFNASLSFSRLVRSRKMNIDPFTELAAGSRLADEIASADGDADSCSRKISSGVSTAKRVHPNSLAFGALQLPEKKLKCDNGGNFVRLNINGYTRRKKFINARGSCSTKSRSKRRGMSRKSLAKKTGRKSDDEGELVDIATEVAWEQGRKRSRDVAVEAAVAAVIEDPSDENLTELLKIVHGFDSFRNGQLEAIKKVVAGESTMLVLPTGAGKSLCYQLPALILPGLTLVISPLLSLMIDQLKKLPPSLSGGLLASNQTSGEFSETMQRLHEGEIKVLFVSPERLLNQEFLTLLKDSRSVSLVVIDEAHCISEWSHNFRPSYLRLRASLLRRKLNVSCVLAMTATATAQTLDDVMSALDIPSSNLIQTSQIRENLRLSMSLSSNRSKDLLSLLKSSPFADVKSIIVYCKFQAEADAVCKYLCDNTIHAKSYHSGLATKVRTRIQELFCANKIRVVVATVAFGMGLDKSDVGGVIHYSLPESLEEYIQETGRAGRDGRIAYCHLLLDTTTYYKIRSLLYSDGVDEYAISKLIQDVFCSDKIPPGSIRSMIKASASQEFDIKEEAIMTILTKLEIGDQQYIELLPQLNVTCALNFHKTSPQLLSDKNHLVQLILAKSEIKSGNYVFDVPTVANSLKTTSTEVLDQLQNLKAAGEVSCESKDPAYCFILLQKPSDYCSLSSHLTKWLIEVENAKIKKFDEMFHVASFATNECKSGVCSGNDHTACIQEKIHDYFCRNVSLGTNLQAKLVKSSPFLPADIKVFLQMNSSWKFTPRAVARIMHGISSPAYPYATWSKNHFWGRYVEIDFSVVMEAAKAELVKYVAARESLARC